MGISDSLKRGRLYHIGGKKKEYNVHQGFLRRSWVYEQNAGFIMWGQYKTSITVDCSSCPVVLCKKVITPPAEVAVWTVGPRMPQNKAVVDFLRSL